MGGSTYIVYSVMYDNESDILRTSSIASAWTLSSTKCNIINQGYSSGYHLSVHANVDGIFYYDNGVTKRMIANETYAFESSYRDSYTILSGYFE